MNKITTSEYIAVGVIVFLLSIYCVNAYKFTECDFESNYKCEVIHDVGIFVPPAAIFTVWFDTDND